MSRRGWRRIPPLTAGLVLLAAIPAAPADPPADAVVADGTEILRGLLLHKEFQFNALKSFGELDDPQHTILFVFGDANRMEEAPGGLQAFVEKGGALFLATDKEITAEEATSGLMQTAGVRVVGRSVVCADEDACYHQKNFCPFLAPNDDPPAEDLFRGVKTEDSALSTVATNAPSYLEMPDAPPEGLAALAVLPEGCSLEGRFGRLFQSPPLFAVGGDRGAGRVLVMADHSLFINEMLAREDEGNFIFAYNCLKWLRGDDADPRTKVLFVEEGKIQPLFDVPLKELPDELADYLLRHIPEAAAAAVPAMDRDLEQYDEHGGPNRALLQFLRAHGLSPHDLPRDFAVAAAVLLVLYGCYKIGWQARHRSDLQGPLLAAALQRIAPADSVIEQRRTALLTGNNLWEPARDLAREFLSAAGVSATAAPPQVAVQGGWLRRRTTAGRMKRLWRLAYGPPARVSHSEWRRLVREVQALKIALADGTVRIT